MTRTTVAINWNNIQLYDDGLFDCFGKYVDETKNSWKSYPVLGPMMGTAMADAGWQIDHLTQSNNLKPMADSTFLQGCRAVMGGTFMGLAYKWGPNLLPDSASEVTKEAVGVVLAAVAGITSWMTLSAAFNLGNGRDQMKTAIASIGQAAASFAHWTNSAGFGTALANTFTNADLTGLLQISNGMSSLVKSGFNQIVNSASTGGDMEVGHAAAVGMENAMQQMTDAIIADIAPDLPNVVVQH